jgi:hypothetical protein
VWGRGGPRGLFQEAQPPEEGVAFLRKTVTEDLLPKGGQIGAVTFERSGRQAEAAVWKFRVQIVNAAGSEIGDVQGTIVEPHGESRSSGKGKISVGWMVRVPPASVWFQYATFE